MRTIKVAIKELERDCVPVHLLQEILDIVGVVVELKGSYSHDILLIVSLLFKEDSAKVFSEYEGGIVARR